LEVFNLPAQIRRTDNVNHTAPSYLYSRCSTCVATVGNFSRLS